MKIGRRLHKTREALGLKQKELADEVKVTPQHISRLELDQTAPSLDMVVRLCRTLGVSTDYLLTGRDPAPYDIGGAIRAQPGLSPLAKRSLIQLVGELSKTA
jgi:transcriptional regulator with XRE-family HTH domain